MLRSHHRFDRLSLLTHPKGLRNIRFSVLIEFLLPLLSVKSDEIFCVHFSSVTNPKHLAFTEDQNSLETANPPVPRHKMAAGRLRG